jgi:hypothetical protein
VPEALSAPHAIDYTYKRSLGPVLSEFFEALSERRIVGARTAEGRVLVPPAEYDPLTGEAVAGTVEVSTSGEVTTWAWVSEPRPKHPLDRPFAWALVRLDGADTAMLHAVDADEASMRTGLRVRVRWADEPSGSILDIACFEPEA